MLENLYTTKMSGDAKTLQKRFLKIRSKQSRKSKITAVIMAGVLITMALFATVTMAAVTKENVFINGKGCNITPVFIENSLAPKTDSWYVPLRDIFEALGYEVRYDVSKEKYSDLMDKEAFPIFDSGDWDEFTDSETGEIIRISKKEYNDWCRRMVTNEADYYICGATGRINAQMPVIEMQRGDTEEFCQIGSRRMSKGYVFAAPVLIKGKAYISVRAVANIIGGTDNVKWNNEEKDTYYEGILNFDTKNLTIDIDETR